MHETTERLFKAYEEIKKEEATQAKISRMLNLSFQVVANWKSRGVPAEYMLEAERLLGCSATWIKYGQGAMIIRPGVVLEGVVVDGEKRAYLEEYDPFKKYDVKVENCLPITATGDNMADYICNGDMVVFDTSKTVPETGKIFLLQYPNGDVIRQLRQEIDGTWVLESRNQDKRRYPDERIPPEKSDLLVVKGRFVYRQG